MRLGAKQIKDIMSKYVYILYLWFMVLFFAFKAAQASDKDIIINTEIEAIHALLEDPLKEYQENLSENDNIRIKLEKRAKDILISEGYYDAVVISENKNDHIMLTPFEGERYIIDQISYAGDEDILDVTKRKVPLKVGQFLRQMMCYFGRIKWYGV